MGRVRFYGGFMTIAIDAMGGDHAPVAVVDGAVLAASAYPEVALILVGREDIINTRLNSFGGHPRITVLGASEVIEMNEAPVTAIRRKKDSSMVIGMKAVKEGKADGFVSAGNTGALLTGATLIIGRQENVERPALGTMLPNRRGFTLLIDSGANMDAKPSYLLQFAQMGSDYVRRTAGVAQPKVGLVNVGAEEEKGNALVKEAYALLKQSDDINFIGNLEARDIPAGAVDVAVCDGFVGNVVLKYTEGLSSALFGIIKEELTAQTITKIGAYLAKPAFKRLKERFDYREIGGAPFLGLKSLVVKAHGSSDALAIKNAIKQCIIYAQKENSYGI
jgi:glycerol-3-phosphate acyltransferase PlsX